MSKKQKKMSFNAAWSMAVGGMVGGGIFSVLGVVVSIAGQWAWLSFVIGGLIALASAVAYSRLSTEYAESGGVFIYLSNTARKGFAGSLSWILILGYTLTISVYAFTFGHYLSNIFGLGAWFPRATAAAAIAGLIWVNLLGVGEAAGFEIVAVWGKLAVLLLIAVIGIWQWKPEMLTSGHHSRSILNALEGAAAIFMAYEGFQLLSYDYDEIKNPGKTLPRSMIIAVISVIVVYVAVSLGSAMLIGADTIIKNKEVAIASAGKAALGTLGLWLATVAAVFSTGSAINATLFATARLSSDVAEANEIPEIMKHENKKGIPDRAILIIGIVAIVLSVIGSLENLVEAASLVFLFTFGTVNVLAYERSKKNRWIFLLGMTGAAAASIFLCYRLYRISLLSLILLIVVILLAIFFRPWVLKKID